MGGNFNEIMANMATARILGMAGEMKPDIDVCDSHGLTLLAECARHGRLDCVNGLLEMGADADKILRDETVLSYALLGSSSEKTAIIEALLKAGANPNRAFTELAQESDSCPSAGMATRLYLESPLHRAARAGDTDVIRLLARYGVYVNGLRLGILAIPESALTAAIEEEQEEAIAVLRELGAQTSWKEVEYYREHFWDFDDQNDRFHSEPKKAKLFQQFLRSA